MGCGAFGAGGACGSSAMTAAPEDGVGSGSIGDAGATVEGEE